MSEPDPLIELFEVQRRCAPSEKRPLSDAERDTLLEMYGVSRDTFAALQDAPPSLAALIRAGMA